MIQFGKLDMFITPARILGKIFEPAGGGGQR